MTCRAHVCVCCTSTSLPLPHYLGRCTETGLVCHGLGGRSAAWSGRSGNKRAVRIIPTYLANDCLIAIAVEMRDTNALRADGPDNWSILCYGREGGYDYEGTRSVVQNGRFTFRRDDTRAVAMFGCLQVDRHYLSCPLIRYLFTCFEPILRCGGGRAAGMEVCCGVVWCSPQIIKF